VAVVPAGRASTVPTGTPTAAAPVGPSKSWSARLPHLAGGGRRAASNSGISVATVWKPPEAGRPFAPRSRRDPAPAAHRRPPPAWPDRNVGASCTCPLTGPGPNSGPPCGSACSSPRPGRRLPLEPVPPPPKAPTGEAEVEQPDRPADADCLRVNACPTGRPEITQPLNPRIRLNQPSSRDYNPPGEGPREQSQVEPEPPRRDMRRTSA